MPTRMTLTIEKTLPDEDGARQMDELRVFLAARGWDILAEEGDQAEESPTGRLGPRAEPPLQNFPVPTMVRCPHCKGAGRVGGAGVCGLCHGVGKVVEGLHHEGRCCS